MQSAKCIEQEHMQQDSSWCAQEDDERSVSAGRRAHQRSNASKSLRLLISSLLCCSTPLMLLAGITLAPCLHSCLDPWQCLQALKAAVLISCLCSARALSSQQMLPVHLMLAILPQSCLGMGMAKLLLLRSARLC